MQHNRANGDLTSGVSEPEALLTRRERLRAERLQQNAVPARISLRAGAVTVAVAALLSWAAVSWVTGRSETAELPEAPALDSTAEHRPLERPEGPEEEAAAVLLVHVAGAVAQPQVVELEPGDRVADAVQAAGGFTEEAAQHGLNLAAEAQDGSLIYVPTADELASGENLPPFGASTESSPGQEEALININTAEAGQLEQLPGIGPALAERIITYRETNGEFSSLEELAAVSGIGPAIIENIADQVTW